MEFPRKYLAMCMLTWASTSAADVVFTGLDADQEANARALMPLASATCDSARWRVERLFRDADRNLANALRALGYYDITIAKSLAWAEECWRASFEVRAGEPVRLRAVDIQVAGAAESDTGLRERIFKLAPASGEVLNHGTYEQFKKQVLQAALVRGYFDAAFSRSEVQVDRQARAADLALHLESGPRYRFGELTFSEGIIDESILRSYSDIEPGQEYSDRHISDLYDVLRGSGYFETVMIRTEPLDTEAKTVPVQVALTPGARKLYTVGAGYASDTGPQFRAAYFDRRRNDRGHQFESRLFGSAVKSEWTTSYRMPRNDPRKEWLSIQGGFQHEDTDTSEHDAFKVGVARTRGLSESWLETTSLEYLYEDFTIGARQATSRLVIPGINWESVRGRELTRVTDGRRLVFDLRGASDSLGSNTSFLQFSAGARWIRAFGERTRFLARARLGTTVEDDFDRLPASLRFFAGGDQSVRGYDFESLGPADETGTITGGSHLLEGSLEIERMFGTQWAVAAFIDTGSAFNHSDPEFSTGAGIGLRWYSPVGPVRLDLAHPFDDPDNSFRIHISLGPDL